MAARLLNQVRRARVKVDDVLKHANALVERAVLVVAREAVLLQIVLLDQARRLQHNLVRLRQRVLADELHNLVQVVLLLQHLLSRSTHAHERRVEPVVERQQRVVVLRVADQPIDGGEVLALRKLLVQAPEHLHDAERCRGDRVAEVAAGRRHGTHHRHASRSRRRAEAAHLARTLVETCQASRKVRRVSAVSRHLRQASGNLAKCLRPSARGVAHHRVVVPHVAVILRERDAGVDGRLARRHGHVRSVRNQSRALHDRLLATVGHRHRQLRKVHENFRHFVPSLPTSDVNYAVAVRELAESLADDRLAAAERTRYRARATEHGGEECVEHALAREKRRVCGKLLRHRSRRAHWPLVRQRVARFLPVVLELDDGVVDAVRALRREVRDAPLGAGRQHALVVKQGIFRDHAEDVTTRRQVTLTQHCLRAAHKFPARGSVERRHGNSLGYVDVARDACDVPERSLHAVEDAPEHSRPEFHGQRLARSLDNVANAQPARLFVRLYGCEVTLESDDLAHEPVRADTHELVHGSARHVGRDDDGSGYLRDDA
mmetsp:Transcript_10955/g.27776  ORF Transcript_10955/g.27776 Transcript_10955/m.27776 type:complete len:547 (+) Transcript_10955:398-2038(+)